MEYTANDRYMTVKELKEAIKGLPDDTRIALSIHDMANDVNGPLNIVKSKKVGKYSNLYLTSMEEGYASLQPVIQEW